MADVEQELEKVVAGSADEIGALPWVWEADRWAELVFCLINAHRAELRGDAFTEYDAFASRAITGVLATVELIEPADLAKAIDTSSDAAAVLRWILGSFGYEPDDAASLIGLLAPAAEAVVSSFDGKVQQFLRARGAAMRDELAAVIGDKSSATREGVAQWLQNVANLPISVDDYAVRAFCSEHGCTAEDLEQAADSIGLNMALVDDAIRIWEGTGADAGQGEEGMAQSAR